MIAPILSFGSGFAPGVQRAGGFWEIIGLVCLMCARMDRQQRRREREEEREGGE